MSSESTRDPYGKAIRKQRFERILRNLEQLQAEIEEITLETVQEVNDQELLIDYHEKVLREYGRTCEIIEMAEQRRKNRLRRNT